MLFYASFNRPIAELHILSTNWCTVRLTERKFPLVGQFKGSHIPENGDRYGGELYDEKWMTLFSFVDGLRKNIYSIKRRGKIKIINCETRDDFPRLSASHGQILPCFELKKLICLLFRRSRDKLLAVN